MDGRESSPCMGQNLPTSKKEKKKTDSSQNNRRECARRCFGQHQNVFLLDSELGNLQNTYLSRYKGYINQLSTVPHHNLKNWHMERSRLLARKKKLINNTSIPQREIEIIARCIFPDILAFYKSEEGQREFAEWKAQQAEKSDEKTVIQVAD